MSGIAPYCNTTISIDSCINERRVTNDSHLRIGIIFENVEIVKSVRIRVRSFSTSVVALSVLRIRCEASDEPSLFQAKGRSVLRNTVNMFVAGKGDVETERFGTCEHHSAIMNDHRGEQTNPWASNQLSH